MVLHEKAAGSVINSTTQVLLLKTIIILWYAVEILILLILSHKIFKKTIKRLELIKLIIFTTSAKDSLK